MDNRHVKTLYYRVEIAENIDYDKAKPVSIETDEFTLYLNSKQISFEMKTRYSKQEQAKPTVDSFLRRWEVLIGLEQNPGDLKFVFERAEFISTSPDNNHSTTLNIHNCFLSQTLMDAIIQKSMAKFPLPTQHFCLSPDVETMYNRYKAYREGRESLLSMAYMCLSVLEASANGRKKASQKYSIAMPILNKLGTLCSEKGGQNEARKSPKNKLFQPLSIEEKEWITKVIKAIIRRVGEYAYDPKAPFKQLTKDDFSPTDYAL